MEKCHCKTKEKGLLTSFNFFLVIVRSVLYCSFELYIILIHLKYFLEISQNVIMLDTISTKIRTKKIKYMSLHCWINFIR